ncbi:MAG: hypothetical protein LV481_09155 [Methylacidiphilales bacterium]|nr:hypothetical protein [Candidatus Methylacidiphilales bacterium]
MKKGFALLALMLCAAVARADVPLPTWNDKAAQTWWAQNPTPDKWPQAVDQLRAQLEANYKSNGASAFSDSDFQGWLEHLEWVRLGLDSPDILADPNNLKTFVVLGNDTAVSHLFIRKLDPLNVEKQALLNLLKLAQANLDDLNTYAALGVAFSLVFDKPFPRDWPHHQVDPQAVPVGDLDVVQRFNFYVQSDRDKKLDLDLTQQTFENLKFLVDSEVKLSELTYAQSNPKRIPYDQFDQAFSSIQYDMTRDKPGKILVNWGLPTYTLKDIETAGGICIDQAYYATILGKGLGIPTVSFRGQGTGGGHAWFGYLSSRGEWQLDCGKYANQSYPRGYALDPQTWRWIDDTQLGNFFKNIETSTNYPAAMTGLAWAGLHQNDPLCRQILDDTRSVMPELSKTWAIEAEVLRKMGASDDDQKTFYQNWITQFQSFPDLKVEGQELLLAVLKKTNDPGADELQQDIVLENRSSDFDQGVLGAAGTIEDKIKAGDWDGAQLEFETTIRDFGDQGGGSLFYNVIVPYVETCLKNGHVDQADNGLRFVRDRMSVDSSTLLGEGFVKLQSDVDKQKKSPADGGNASP